MLDWQTGEEVWDVTPAMSVASRWRRWRRGWRWWLVGFLLFLLLGAGLWWGAQVRITAVAETLAQDVATTHLLLQKAAADNDLELFNSLLWPSDSVWQSLQQERQTYQLFAHRQPLGLHATFAVTPSTQVTLTSSLREAVVVAHQPYLTAEGERVWLRQTAVYRYKESQDERGQWYAAPLGTGEAFWGEIMHYDGAYLSMRYPARDGAVSERLAHDLDVLLARLCQFETVPCSPDFPLQLDLSPSDEAALSLRRNLPFIMTDEGKVTLPPPTLLGVPVDEAGYDIVYTLYARQLAVGMMNQFLTQDPTVSVTVRQKMADLDLTMPPPVILQQSDAVVAASVPVPTQDVQAFCTVYGRTQLLRFNPRTGVWIDEQVDTPGLLLSSASRPSMAPLPDDSGVLLQAYRLNNYVSRWQTFAWREGKAHLLVDEERPHSFLPFTPALASMSDPTGQHVVDYRWRQVGGVVVRTLDLDDCTAFGCGVQSFDGVPLWAPDRQHLIIVPIDDAAPFFKVQNRAGEDVISHVDGWSPFWLDDGTFGYLRRQVGASMLGERGEVADSTPLETTAVIITNLDAVAKADPLLTMADFLTQIPTERPSTLALTQAFVHPQHPEHFFVYADAADGKEASYLFAVSPQTGQVLLLWQIEDMRVRSAPVFTPDGRYLVVTLATGLMLYEMESAETAASPEAVVYPSQSQYTLEDFFGYDWDENGRWLLLDSEDGIVMVAPEIGYEQSIPYPVRGCTEAAWVNRGFD